jgi:hypothetical protein
MYLKQIQLTLGALGALLVALAAPAATWHVSPAGDDTHSGSEKAPFATLNRAVEAASNSAEAGEIVLHAGVYPGNVTIPAPASAPSNPPPLLIRAASKKSGGFEEVVIDGGQKIKEAKLVDAARGIYFFPVALANFEPSMWEADKRVRYPFVADRRSVEVFPGSLAPGREFDDGALREGLYFRTSDSRPPAEHDLGLARDRKGLVVLRPNVTIRGLRFRNFQLYFGVCAVSIEAARVTVESCEVWNAWGAFMVSEGIPDAKILACTAQDVATGVKSYGRNTVVEDCRFIRINDPFEVQEYEQDQCGIQFYSSHTQTARRNLCAGFNLGIFIKASGGVLILEDNTVVAPPKGGERGIGPNTWRPGSICRGNIVTGYSEPMGLSTLNRECLVTSNQIWLASSPKRAEETAAAIKADAGGDTVVARPVFVNEAKGDYRLAPGSVGATSGPEAKPLGALGVAAPGTAVQIPPEAGIKAAPAPARSPRLIGLPVIRTNDYGAVILFRTDLPCTAKIDWGADSNRLDRRISDVDDYRLEAPVPGADDTKIGTRENHALAIIGGEAGRTYGFRITLDNGMGLGLSIHQGTFTLAGPTQTWHVAAAGVDAEDRGRRGRPFASIQYAVDRALPGDSVRVAGGVYTGSVWMTHGGIKGHPITLAAEESWDSPSGGAILDGKREADYAIRLGHVANVPETWAFGCLGPAAVAHVRITGFEIRWYNGLCVRADEAQDIVVDRCKFWGRHYVKGRPGICEGIGITHGERITVSSNLFFTLNTAVRFNSGSGLRLINNTAAKCFHRVIGIVGARDIYLRNNSFAFGASYLLQIHGVELNAIDSDYNNFAVYLRSDSAGYKSTPPAELHQREANDFYYGETKALAAWDERTADKPNPYLETLTPWRAATGQDRHAIAAHPRYADPQHRDFRLMTNSPNIGRGENGAAIGALGVAK